MTIRLTLPYPPSVNAMYRNTRVRWGNGRGRVLSDEGHAFKSAVATIAMIERAGYTLEPVKLTIRLFRPRKSGDLDNFIKSVQDSLTGVCWRDDSQVVEIHAYRFEDKKNPRVEIEIAEL